MRRRPIQLLVGLALLSVASVAWARPGGEGHTYPVLFDPEGPLGFLTPRVLVWVFAQLHLLFAAFVLAVPMFALIIQVVGLRSADRELGARYDRVAHEVLTVAATAFSLTAITGAGLSFLLLGLYPRVIGYLGEVFGPSMYLYSLLFFGESFSLYVYYYGWGRLRHTWVHVGAGVVHVAMGIGLMFIANAWTTFAMAPAGVDASGAVIDRWDAFFNHLLHPINTHRLIANLCMGGSVVGAYAAWRFLSTDDPEARRHYDWMGYVGNLVAIGALLPLPFAGYWLGFEIYGYNQQLGVYMMGGVLSWFFILQAVLIGGLFLAANYYLWVGMERIEGAERYRGWIKGLLGVITLCVLVWATPRSLVLGAAEIAELGGTSHPLFGALGLMSAKNTAVNLMILTTFLSFVLYRRGNKVATVPWAETGKRVQALAFGAAAAVVLVIGIGGYVPGLWLESSRRIAMSPWQVAAVLACMVLVMAIDIPLYRGARSLGPIRWGEVGRRSQYALIFLAVTFTWLMALMGFVRSSLRQHWHVYEVMPDTSPWAYTPAIGYTAMVITAVVVAFFVLIGFVFWVAGLRASPAPGR